MINRASAACVTNGGGLGCRGECIDTATKALLTPICLSLINTQLAATTLICKDEQNSHVTMQSQNDEENFSPQTTKNTLASLLQEGQRNVLHFYI